MISLACAIIMLHAVVPHHHHDCCEAKGLVFETEVACHCESNHHECDHRHSHHPFNTSHNSFILTVPPVMDDMCTPSVTGGQMWWSRSAVPLVEAPVMGALSLRAPPYVS